METADPQPETVQSLVDRLYAAGDQAAHLIMGQMVDLIHDRQAVT